MGLPVSVTFHRVDSSTWIEADVRKRATRLEMYCRLLRSCRIVIDVPHRHHQHGNRFRLHIELVVPDEAIAVTRDAPLTAPARDLALVIREAFDVARRRLQDYTRRHRLDVKQHSLRAAGPRRPTKRRLRTGDGRAA